MSFHDGPQGTSPHTISLLLGHPDPATLLSPELRSAMQQLISSPRALSALQYGPEQGTRALIDVLVEKIKREQGLTLEPGNLMIVAGSTHAVDLLARLYVGAGGVVLVEAPSYADALHVFRDQRAELYSVPMDESGLLPAALEQQVAQLHASGKAPAMLYTVPNFQNPTGITLPEVRRREVLSLARRYNFLIVEDDVYRDLAFEDTLPTSFYALAQDHQPVVSIGSFSKTLAPGLRLGWLLGNEEIIEHCVNSGTTQMGGGANPFSAHLVAEYFHSGFWEKHLLHLQSLYKIRRNVMLSALTRDMPSDVQWTHPAGGFFIWLRLPEQVFAQHIKRLALQQGVAVAAGEGFFVDPADGEHHVRLAYSCASLEEIDSAVRTLAQVIRSARSWV